MRDTAAPPPSRWWRLLVVALVTVAAAAAIGGGVTYPSIPTWYAALRKPGFTPPNGVFGPVWTILYLMMAAAFWRILRRPSYAAGRRRALTAFLVQLGLNALWSVAFFGFHSPSAGLVVIAGLEAMILATIVLFRRLDRRAAALLVPYALWVAYAAALNVAIWRMNPLAG